MFKYGNKVKVNDISVRDADIEEIVDDFGDDDDVPFDVAEGADDEDLI